MDLERSPLALPFPEIPPIAGVSLRIARAGYKDWGRCDLTYLELAEGTAVAGVFTKNVCCSSEVELGREQVKSGRARALVVNAGNSNAFTGYRGREAVEQIMGQVAEHLGCPPTEVFVSSTGVIGVPLPKDKAQAGVEAVLDAVPCSWEDAAATIGTTDTFNKGALATAIVDGRTVTLAAIIKGSGMIAPDMATMLGYIVTDAVVEPVFLQELLSAANKSTFSCITVDSDTSTSDTVLAFATGRAGNPPLASFADNGADAFAAALHDVCLQLAQLVVRDGEGAQKFITVDVSGAVSDDSARRIGLAIANSPLIKTAIAGEDANWGRVVMAVGKAGEPADRDRLSIGFGGVWAAKDGQPVTDYDEEPVAAHLKGREIDIAVDIGLGDGRATVWTCDLTHGYIAINADYRSLSEALDRAVHALMRETAEKIVMPRYRNLADSDVFEKGVDDPVTIADREAEAMLEEGLARLLPEAAVVGEEAVHSDKSVLERLDGLCWIIDPIDGTANFASGHGHFALMLALADAGETQASWIYDPRRDRLCRARLGAGAFIDDERLVAKPSGASPPRIAAMTRYMHDTQRAIFSDAIAPHYERVDVPGCAAEQYPLVALGDHDVAIFERTLAWDHAAGCLFLNEAGGKSARPDGSPYRVNSPRKGMISAASAALFEQLAERLASAGYAPGE